MALFVSLVRVPRLGPVWQGKPTAGRTRHTPSSRRIANTATMTLPDAAQEMG
jgi:hypothetical protein